MNFGDVLSRASQSKTSFAPTAPDKRIHRGFKGCLLEGNKTDSSHTLQRLMADLGKQCCIGEDMITPFL